MLKYLTVFCLFLAVAATAKFCRHKGKLYPVGKSFKDDCNTCTCGMQGFAICTKIYCGPPVCKYKGNTYRVGQSFQEDCNLCFCRETGVGCTKKQCRRRASARRSLLPTTKGCIRIRIDWRKRIRNIRTLKMGPVKEDERTKKV
ncbi:kielin/chordin-like protein [Octopus sinensis]|uniref:Kielin/chordin-like protein n=1 Tax=Octopus sinensis TaxID=2607531 RepID=A0A7E6FS45_9MOLL|nr:kielin/chordin-like protein [Octopus sinensis]